MASVLLHHTEELACCKRVQNGTQSLVVCFFSVLALLWLHRRRKACQYALLSRNIESIEWSTPSLVYHSTVGTADIFHHYLLRLTSVACLQRRSVCFFGIESTHLHKWPTRLIFRSHSMLLLAPPSLLTFAPQLNWGQPYC